MTLIDCKENGSYSKEAGSVIIINEERNHDELS